MIGNEYGIKTPFEVAFFSFILATIYVQLAMPYISPESMAGDSGKPGGRSLSNFFAPLRLLAPQKLRLEGGEILKHHGVLYLCLGVFIGVVSQDSCPAFEDQC
jgi:hypothetical protein